MASFASLARGTGFQSSGLPRGDGTTIQPLPVATSIRPGTGGRGGAGVRSIGGKGELREEEPAVQGPPPPTREELEAARAAQRETEQRLAAAERELEAMRAQLQAAERSSRALAEAFSHAQDELQAEMRAAYADVVLEGCRRLLGSLSESEAIFHARLDTVSEQLVLESDVVLKVAPRHKKAAELAIFGRIGWSVEVDPGMDDGCEAICRNSLVDARLETAFQGLERSLGAWLSQDGRGSQSK